MYDNYDLNDSGFGDDYNNQNLRQNPRAPKIGNRFQNKDSMYETPNPQRADSRRRNNVNDVDYYEDEQ